MSEYTQLQIVDGNCWMENDCPYELTNSYVDRVHIQFAIDQLRKDDRRKWQVKKDEKGYYSLWTYYKTPSLTEFLKASSTMVRLAV